MSIDKHVGDQMTEYGITVTELVARIRQRQTQWHDEDLSGYDWSQWGESSPGDEIADALDEPLAHLAMARQLAREDLHILLKVVEDLLPGVDDDRGRTP